MLTGDNAVDYIASLVGVSKPRTREILKIAREIELENKIEALERRTAKRAPCRIVGSCAIYDFPKSRIIRNVGPEVA